MQGGSCAGPTEWAMAEVRRLLGLAWPVVLGQLGLVGMGTADLLMVGPLGGEATASVGLGHVWSFAVLVVALGAATGIDPLVTQAYGAGDPRRAGLAAARGLVLCGLLLVPVIGLHLFAAPALRLLGQPASVVPDAAAYCRILALSMPPLVAFALLRQLLQGGGAMRPAMWVIGLANLVNVAGNAVLIEPFGVAGVAWSTVIVRWVMCGALVGLGWPVLRAAWPRGPVLAPGALAHLAGLALPVGFQLGLEVWAFTAASLVAGWFGANAMAAHVASMNAASLAFMAASGVAAAAATRVGNLVGAGLEWRRAGWTAVALGAATMTVTGTLFLLFPEHVGRAYTVDLAVIGLVATVLPVAALFGLFDGVQVVAFGVLRGLGDTRIPSLFNLVGYWLVGLPVGAWLAVQRGWGLLGVWVGLAVALLLVAALLVARIAWHSRQWAPQGRAVPQHRAAYRLHRRP